MRRWVGHARTTTGTIVTARLRLGRADRGPAQPRALSHAERAEVLGVLHHERFVDQAPASVYATCWMRAATCVRCRRCTACCETADEVRERRRQATHPAAVKPELLATGPNAIWSWDITKLLGPEKWTYFHLYVVIDIFSRYVPGWLLATRETAELAERLLAARSASKASSPTSSRSMPIAARPMASKPVALLLADLGVTKSHSRPHCSNDNPYSEAQFKTLKYRPEFPDRFGSIEDGRAFCQRFFG